MYGRGSTPGGAAGSTAAHLRVHVAESNTLTVWSPWVDAKCVPSGEKARAMVDLAPVSSQ